MLPVSSKDFLFDAQANVFGPCKGVLNWNTTLGSGPSNQGTNNFPAKNCFSSTLVTSAPSETFDVFCLCGGFRGTLTYVLPTVAAPNGAPTTFTVSFTNASHETETDKFTFRATVVPEPATWLVLTVGGGLLWRRLRHHDRTEV
ncbi:MAG TPA: PEP-CTERM sorting domain-containing protein [Candidatus Xenobia bacterium]